VADHEAMARGGRERAQSHEIDLELVEPRLGRDVERREGDLARDAVARDAVTRLEAAHRRLDIGIVDLALAGARIEVARELQPRAQRNYARMADAEAQPVARRHGGPAAGRDDLLVALDRRLGGLRGAG